MTEEFTTINIKPSRSAPLRFKGKLIAQTEWTTGRGDQMRFEIWETEGGALIAVRDGDDGDGNGYTDAIVVEPIYKAEQPMEVQASGEDGSRIVRLGPTYPVLDEAAMRFTVLGFFEWHDRARSMVRKQLKWSLLRRVA